MVPPVQSHLPCQTNLSDHGRTVRTSLHAYRSTAEYARETRQTRGDDVGHDFRENLGNMLKARFPILYIESFEEQRVIDEVSLVAQDAGYVRTPRAVVTWSVTDGLRELGGEPRAGTTDPAKALDAMLRVDTATVFIARDLHAQLGDGHRPPDPTVVRLLRDVASAFKAGTTARALILVSPLLRIPPELEKDISLVDFPLPDEKSIRNLLESMIVANSANGRIRVEVDDAGRELLTKAALGLTLHEAENAFARAMVGDGTLGLSDVEVVLEEKQQTIRKSGLLEFVPVRVGLDDVGGLENLKRWLARRENSWLAEAAAYGLPAPKGVLITGVPGCGKSMTAKAIAAAWGLPLLRLDIGRVFAGLVGSSEQNMRTAIRTAEATSPCVLWIDEIEKGFSGVGPGSGDSGTSSRVFGSFLTWMQEKTRPVFVIATANNIDALPAEFLRKGRFDEIFFVDLPTRNERMKIWELHLMRRLVDKEIAASLTLGPSLHEELAAVSEGYSGAEIEQAVVAALFEAFAEKRHITREDLMDAVENMVPLSITQAEQIGRVRAWADVRAVAATATADRSEYDTTDPDGQPPRPLPPDDGALGQRPQSGIARSRGGRTVDF
jgi:ATP-dependent 26S proteasome regulatory subunit